jgi:hypothetical protein
VVQTNVLPAAPDPVGFAVTSIPERDPLRPGDRVTHTLRFDNRGLPRRPVTVTLPAGAATDFEAVVDAGGGSVIQQHPQDRWQWRGSLPADALVNVVLDARVEAAIPLGADTTALNGGQPLRAFGVCSVGALGTATPPTIALQRPVASRLAVTSATQPYGAAAASLMTWGQSEVAIRPGAELDVQLVFAEQAGQDLGDVRLRLPVPAAFELLADPPFVGAVDPGASYDAATRTVSWAGALASGESRTVTFRGRLDPAGRCGVGLAMRGTTAGGPDDVGASLLLRLVPDLGTEPYLAGIDPVGGLQLWSYRPGASAGPEPLFCGGEILQQLGQGPGGDLYVSGLPSFRLNPSSLELEHLPQGSFSDVATDLSAGAPRAVVTARGRVTRLDPSSGVSETVLDDPSLGELDHVSVDPEGRILAVSLGGRLVRIDPRPGVPVPAGAHEVLDVSLSLPFAAELGTLQSQSVPVAALDANGDYLALVRSVFVTGAGGNSGIFVDSIASIDRSTLQAQIVVPAVAARSQSFSGPPPLIPASVAPLLPSRNEAASLSVSDTGEIYVGTRSPGLLAVIRRGPPVTVTVLVDPPGPDFDPDAADLEWIQPAAANAPPNADAGGPYDVVEGSALRLDSSGSSDPEGGGLSYSWTLAGVSYSGVVVDVPADDDFSGTATLTVSDDAGAQAVASAPVTVRNAPPVAVAGPGPSGYWGQALAFAGSASDPGPADVAAGLQAQWSFGDGDGAAGLQVSHVYAAAGGYTARLDVTDKDGGVGTDSAAVVVEARPLELDLEAPVAAEPGEAVELVARIGDLVDAATARLEGRTIRFAVVGVTFEATTDADGVARLETPPLAEQTAVSATFDGDADYLGDGDEAVIEVEEEEEEEKKKKKGHVTGKGLLTKSGHRAEFHVHRDREGVEGELTFWTGHRRLDFEIETLAIARDGRSARFTGTDAEGHRFEAEVEKRGSWWWKRDDRFRLWIDGELQTGDGRLKKGRISISRNSGHRGRPGDGRGGKHGGCRFGYRH